MRTGRLETPAELLVLDADIRPQLLDWLWCGIRAKDAADAPLATGLRNAAKIEVRAWWDARLLQGRYLRADERLFHIDSVRDVTGLQSELVMTATELSGEGALYTSPGGVVASCRVFLAHGVLRPGEFTGKVEYSTQLEAALIEVGRPQPGGVFVIGTDSYRVAALVDNDDGRVVRRMWVKRV